MSKKFHYTYYSYEEFGRGYIGVRSCNCNPEEDRNYFGSYYDKTFKPTKKIILNTYSSRKEAMRDEIILHEFYQVHINPYFANKSKATTESFFVPLEVSIKNGKNVAHIMSKEQRIQNGYKTKELGIGIFGLSEEQRSENGKKGGKVAGKIQGKRNAELKTGVCGLTKEQLVEIGRISGNKTKEAKTGIFGLSDDAKIENCKKGGEIVSTQRWKCTVTNYISTPGPLSSYQKARGIDTSNRIRVN